MIPIKSVWNVELMETLSHCSCKIGALNHLKLTVCLANFLSFLWHKQCLTESPLETFCLLYLAQQRLVDILVPLTVQSHGSLSWIGPMNSERQISASTYFIDSCNKTSNCFECICTLYCPDRLWSSQMRSRNMEYARFESVFHLSEFIWWIRSHFGTLTNVPFLSELNSFQIV